MPKPKAKTGRPPHAPTEKTRQQVTSLVLFGLDQVKVATVIGISEPTLLKHYQKELETTHAIVGAKIATGLAQLAMRVGEKPKPGEKESRDSALTAAIFYLKTQAGWRETNALEHSGPGGAPIPILDVSKLSDKELAIFERLAAKAGVAAAAGKDDA